MRKFDSFTVDLFTRFSHRFQRLTGRSNFFIAKIVSIIVSASAMILAISSSFTLHQIAFPFISFLALKNCEKCQRREDSLSNETTKELWWLTQDDFLFRMSYTFLLSLDMLINLMLIQEDPGGLITINNISSTLYSASMFTFTYLISVNPLPPCKGRIAEWIESFSYKPILTKSQ